MKKRKLGRKLLGFLLTLTILVGLMPGMGLTVYAADVPYASLKNTTSVIIFDNKQWYLIDYDDSTVTLLSKECVGASTFCPKTSGNTYRGSTVESYVSDWYTNNISTDAKAAVNGNGMFLLTKEQAINLSTDVLKCSQASGAYDNHWWLCTPGSTSTSAEMVNGESGQVSGYSGNVWIAYGVRPALKLNLESVIFSSESNTLSKKVNVSGVSLNKEEVTLKIDGTESLTATVSPADDTDKTVSWTSSDTTVATVDTAGKVTAVGAGTAVITATATNGTTATDDDKSAACTVTVEKSASAITKVPTANTLTYNGKAQELVTKGEAAGGEMQYALGTKDAATEEYTTSIPKATDAGTYYVWYKVAGDDNHIDSDAACVKVTIAEKKDDADTVAKPEYKNTSGEGSVWTLESTGTLTFTFSRSENDSETIKHFAGAKVDGTELGSNDYSFKSGSVIIDLKADYLNELSAGKHTLTAMFDDGDDVTVEFTIKEKASEGGKKSDTTPDNKKSDVTPGNKKVAKTDAPRTGDAVNLKLIFIVMILSMCDIFALCNLRSIFEEKKRRR